MLAALGRTVYRRRLPVIAGWAVVALAGAVFGGSVYDRTQSIAPCPPEPRPPSRRTAWTRSLRRVNGWWP
jgi:uncharacterized membrane protein YdfJ with MMPL/SSD domain